MIEAGLQLMLLGMAVVFVFLVILVVLMTLMSAITRRFETPAAATAAGTGDVPTPGPRTGSSAQQNNPHIAAVLAAVAQHHGRRAGNVPHTTNTPSGDHR